MTTRRERQEARERRAEMRRRYLACHWCQKPVVAGQVDGLGRPSHHLCSLACWRHRRFGDKAFPNPKLPLLQELSPKQGAT